MTPREKVEAEADAAEVDLSDDEGAYTYEPEEVFLSVDGIDDAGRPYVLAADGTSGPVATQAEIDETEGKGK